MDSTNILFRFYVAYAMIVLSFCSFFFQHKICGIDISMDSTNILLCIYVVYAMILWAKK
jgi:hypothetical protein